jgi:hypothetical protein
MTNGVAHHRTARRNSGAFGHRNGFDGLGYTVAAACGCLLFALVAFVAVRQSPDEVLLWTGTKVVGAEQHGVIFYSWNDRRYSIQAPHYSRDSTPLDVSKPRVTLYVDPANPAHAVTDSTGTRVADGAFVVGPLALGGLILGIGVLRRRTVHRNFLAMTAGETAGP